MKKILLTIVLFGFTVICFNGAQAIPMPPNSSESICGATEDFEDVELYSGGLGVSELFVDTYQSSVGQLQWNSNLSSKFSNSGNVSGVRWCSGTLISRNLFLTAGHCFDPQVNDGLLWDSPLVDGSSEEISPEVAAQNMHVNFNYQLDENGNQRVEQKYDVLKIVEYRENGQDFAILELAGNPGYDFGFNKVSRSIPSLNDKLTVIQHPSGDVKKTETGNYGGVVPSGSLIGYFRYMDLDTKGGTSGSGVLSSAGELIGVHTNAGCSASGGANHGLLIDDLVASSEVLSSIASMPASIGVFRDGWWHLDANNDYMWSGTSVDISTYFGQAGDKPLAISPAICGQGADLADFAVMRPNSTSATWFVTYNNQIWDSADVENTFNFGSNGTPLLWDGSFTEFKNGEFIVDFNHSSSNDFDDISYLYGASTDNPIVGRWVEGSRPSVGVFKSGKWYIDMNGNNDWDMSDAIWDFGQAGDLPVVADFDGDGVDDIAVFRNGTWYVDGNGNRWWDGVSGGDFVFQFGQSGDIPVTTKGLWECEI